MSCLQEFRRPKRIQRCSFAFAVGVTAGAIADTLLRTDVYTMSTKFGFAEKLYDAGKKGRREAAFAGCNQSTKTFSIPLATIVCGMQQRNASLLERKTRQQGLRRMRQSHANDILLIVFAGHRLPDCRTARFEVGRH